MGIPSGHAVAAALYKSLPYRTIDDFTMISLLTEYPFVVVTYADHPIRTFPDLIDTARTRSAPLLFGSAAGRDQVGVIDGLRSTFGRTYAAEPDRLIEQLRADRAVMECDTLLLTIPSQLGVEANMRIVDSFATHVAPALGWHAS